MPSEGSHVLAGESPDGVKARSPVAWISSALSGGADLFVNGDIELLELRKIGNMEIVSPRGFWEKLKARS